MSNENLSLENLKVSNLPELQGWKNKMENLVKENPFVEITDNKTYEIACKSRTALLKGRTSLEGQDKLIASKLAGFRKDVKSETEKLISITLPHEEKQQVEVKRYESIKENERLERERIENERIAAIKNKIEALETESYESINKMTYKDIDEHVPMSKLYNTGFDFEEYDIVFDQMVERVKAYASTKIDSLIKEENQRVENERLAKESELLKQREELQSKRLKELLPYNHFANEGSEIDITKLYELSEPLYKAILESKKFLFETDKQEKKEAQDKIDSDNLEREQQAEKEKQQVFEIRKNRLSKIGFSLEPWNVFTHPELFAGISKESISDCNAIDFETIITDAELAIEKSKNDKIELEKQIEKDLELAKADAEKLKKENKARIKRLANDKKIISESLEVYFADLHLDTENQETKDFIEKANTKIQELKNELLTELNNL